MLSLIIYAQSPPPKLQDLEGVFQNLLGAIIPFAGIVLFIFLVIGGYKFITSGGSPEKAAGAKATITYAIIGIVVIALSYLILSIIATFTGLGNEILEFRIFRQN